MMAGHAINSRFVRFINMSNNTLKYLFAEILPQHIESQEVLQKLASLMG
jgi:hypothetical protein